MAGPFDAGTVSARLVLNLDEWSANLEKAKKDTSTFAGAVTAHKEEIEKLGKSFALVGGAIVGSLGMMLKSATDFTLEAGRMAQKTGIAVETVSGLREAANKTGVSMDTLNVGLRRYAAIVSDAAAGNKTAQETLAKLGISATDATGKIKPMEQLLFETADKFKGMADGSDKAALAVDLFGRSGTEMIMMLNKGSEGIKGFIADNKAMGNEITAAGVAKAKAFSLAIGELDDAFMSIKLVIANALMPVVKFLADTFVSVGKAIRWTMDVFPPLTNLITIIVGALGGLSTILGIILLALPKLVAAYLAMSTAIASMATAVVAASAKMALSIPIYAAILAAVLAINAGINAYASAQDRAIKEIVVGAEKQAKTMKWIGEQIRGVGTESSVAFKMWIAQMRGWGWDAEKIAAAVYASYGKVIDRAKQVAADTAAMAGKVKDIQTELIDKLRILMTSEYAERIYQAKKYYDDLRAKVKGSLDEAKVVAQIDKAQTIEIAKIKKEQAEASAEAYKKADDKRLKSFIDTQKKIVAALQNSALKFKDNAVLMGNEFNTFGITIETRFNKLTTGIDKAVGSLKKKLTEVAVISAKNFGAYIQVMQEGFSTFFSGLQQMSDNRYQREFQAMDAEYEKKRKAIEDSLLSETEKNAAMTALDKEYADKKKALEIKQAEANKKSGISQAIVNTALAIVSALATKPFIPMGLIAAAMAAAAGAIQISVIKSTPLPVMAQGGLINQPTTVLAGEAGPEAILPMRELQRMLGISPSGNRQGNTVNFNGSISAIDSRGMDALFTESIIPRLKRALGNESLTVPVKAVRS